MRSAALSALTASLLFAGESPRYLDAFPGPTPKIDGQISPKEWARATPILGVSGPGNLRWTHTFSPTTSPADLNLRGWVMHDGKQLYFAFDVDDDILYGIDTPRWLPKENPKAHEFVNGKPSRDAFPWFGDEMEILLNAAYKWGPTGSVLANGSSWQMVVNLTKSRLHGLQPDGNKGGLLEGEPRRDPNAFATYSRWIDSGAMTAAAKKKPNGKGYTIEWAIAFNPCVEITPGTFWSPALGDRPVGINIALGDLDTLESGQGNFGNFHHEDWFAGNPKTRTDLRDFGTLWLRANAPLTRNTLSDRGGRLFRNEAPLGEKSIHQTKPIPAKQLKTLAKSGTSLIQLSPQTLSTLPAFLADCDRANLIVELALSQDFASFARALLPYRNLSFRLPASAAKLVRSIDPTRILRED
jgi:hypothetical protein